MAFLETDPYALTPTIIIMFLLTLFGWVLTKNKYMTIDF